MNQSTRDILKVQYAKLPDSLQELVRTPELGENIDAISKTHGLSPEATNTVSDEALLVVLGLSPLTELGDSIATETGISKEEAETIAREITQKIIAPIADDLADFLEKESAAVGEGRTEAPQLPTTEIPVRPVAIPVEVEEKPLQGAAQTATPLPKADKDDAAEMRRVLRENSKTVDIKDFLESLK